MRTLNRAARPDDQESASEQAEFARARGNIVTAGMHEQTLATEAVGQESADVPAKATPDVKARAPLPIARKTNRQVDAARRNGRDIVSRLRTQRCT